MPHNLLVLQHTQAAAQSERRQMWRLKQEFEELKGRAGQLESQQAIMVSTSTTSTTSTAAGGQGELGAAMAGTDGVWKQAVEIGRASCRERVYTKV